MSQVRMTVGELRKSLESLADNLPVILASDSEGNHFRPLFDVVESALDANGEALHPDDAEDGDEPAVVLWP